ncbi:MAG: phosphatidylserine decarboxylase [Syntrophomonas sp.]|nr:phosphatidylserine decarboxylase [Syntrophomonas sp.]
MARRLVCWVQAGDNLDTGERFGLIRFGSCTEIYLPEDATILVQPGQKLKGGETVIARFCE